MATDTPIQAKNYLPTPSDTDLRVLPDGALVTGDWKAAAVARGWGWHVTTGDLTTPVGSGGATAVMDLNRPALTASIPLGWTFRPIRVHIELETPLSATDLDEVETLISVDRTQVSNAAAGTGTVEAPLNMRTDIVGGCPITVVTTASGDQTNPTIGLQLDRKIIVLDEVGIPATALWGKLDHLYEPKNPPFIVGPAIFLIHWGGTVATSGYTQTQFIAFPSSKVTDLV